MRRRDAYRVQGDYSGAEVNFDASPEEVKPVEVTPTKILKKLKRKPCPRCGRPEMNFYFHVKHCKGDPPGS